MRISYPDRFLDNERELMRKCGYAPSVNRKNGQISYLRPLYHNQPYPHFHVYIDRNYQEVIFNLHLDQKKPTYSGFTAHSGDYDGEAIMAEAARLKSILNKMIS